MRLSRYSTAVLLAAIFLCRFAWADAYDPPVNYYSAATGTGAALESQLLTIMSTGHILRTYGNFRDSAAIHDADPNNAGNILLVYNRASVPATWDLGTTWDREHIWPQSLQGGGSVSNNDTGHRADPHALRPCNPSINGSRGNKPFGFETTTGNHGAVPATNYYFPGDVDKGDVARSLFYSDSRWGPSLGLTLVDSAPASFQMGDLSSLIAWHYLDVPDDFERGRHQKVYSQTLNPTYYTNNRNAYIDRPEYVWSVFVDQANDSQITIVGGTPDANGGSARDVDLGRVFVGGAVPAAQSFTLDKVGNDGTYYEVTTAGEATSSVTGRYNAFRTDSTDSRSIDVGLNTNTATSGVKSGTVTIDNLDVTTMGGAGRGANDANDTFDVSLAVLDHATASFADSMLTSSLMYDFGDVTIGGSAPTFEFDVFNLEATPGFTADLDFDTVMVTGDSASFTTDLSAAAGSLALGGGLGQMFSAMLSTVAVGNFSATYSLMFSDEDLPGAQVTMLELTLMGEVLAAGLAGDYNGDGVVDAADYTVWRGSYGQSVIAYSGADGDGDTMIDDDDYGVWRANYGMVAPGGGAGSLNAVPEPASLCLVLMGLAALSHWIPRRRPSAAPLAA